eukprot:GGOE01041213.1.p1 GENE.GGOE01041213.1~~GGOE01041213.1.p1  ORF type:complete len:270 (+),score=85.43 GGOE01041213.1:108-917(+)
MSMAARLPRPQLIAFDLDGTLLNSAKLSQPHADTVQWLKEQGIQVALVTGRSILTATKYWDALQLDTPLVCFNGAYIGRPNEPPLAERALAPADVSTVLRLLRPFGGCISLFPGGRRWVVDRLTERTKHWPSHYGHSIIEAPEVHDDWHESTCKVLFDCEADAIPAAQKLLQDNCGGHLSVLRSMPDKLEVMPYGVDKACGLAELARHLGIQQEHVWAVGDELNDTHMLEWAEVGLVMGQAAEEVKAKGQVVLPPVQEDGLTRLRDLLQ